MKALDETDRLIAALNQIGIVCVDNMSENCNHRMALDFVLQIVAIEQNHISRDKIAKVMRLRAQERGKTK